ncbi:ribonuclease toxin immunity protein CdiI [Massilia sp. Dwa41.01b]|uniref:ribonuclease toxin immunity protein CdiI n=1 Tax=unclassified Massilia TaxID=2609279 RepID=UPI0016005BE3|nr:MULTISPECIES: ribonuclease toxin immunity protein CdiI [unclassified Massilia]QNA88418.1 ribonuclease toxin immunity protein CdiI [Massilia sp. Dwa41.01b]QNA99313.1 ribonuclease toxin immunity protein CdiI [Massilia sp. Se16.2.3]
MRKLSTIFKKFIGQNAVTQTKKVFESLNCHTDDEYQAKEFLNSMYSQGRFVRAIEGIVNREDIIVNDEYCLFPEPDLNEPIAHFEGVKFVAFDSELVISEAACSTIIDQACANYLRLHPEDTGEINAILQKRLF